MHKRASLAARVCIAYLVRACRQLTRGCCAVCLYRSATDATVFDTLLISDGSTFNDSATINASMIEISLAATSTGCLYLAWGYPDCFGSYPVHNRFVSPGFARGYLFGIIGAADLVAADLAIVADRALNADLA